MLGTLWTKPENVYSAVTTVNVKPKITSKDLLPLFFGAETSAQGSRLQLFNYQGQDVRNAFRPSREYFLVRSTATAQIPDTRLSSTSCPTLLMRYACLESEVRCSNHVKGHN